MAIRYEFERSGGNTAEKYTLEYSSFRSVAIITQSRLHHLYEGYEGRQIGQNTTASADSTPSRTPLNYETASDRWVCFALIGYKRLEFLTHCTRHPRFTLQCQCTLNRPINVDFRQIKKHLVSKFRYAISEVAYTLRGTNFVRNK